MALSNAAIEEGAKLVTLPTTRNSLGNGAAIEVLHELDVLGVAFCRVLIFEVFLQNHGGGDGVHGSSGVLELFFGVFCVMQNSSRLLFQQTFRLPTGKALVHHVYG
jgi:hypothetical protein